MGWLDEKGKESKAARQILEAIPEELRGKTPAEIAALLKEAPLLKAKVTELETARTADTAAVTQIKTEFDTIKERLRVAEANNNRQPTPPGPQKEPTDFIDNPDQAFNERAAPLAALSVRNAAITAKMLAQQQLDNGDMASNGKTMDGRLFRAWDTEIMREANTYQTIQLGEPKNWIAIYYLIKGTKADELSNPEIRKQKYAFLEPSSPSTPLPGAPPKNASEELSDAEKHVADKMGVKHEDYLKRKKAMQFVNG
jgi:phage I-like protein